MTDDRPLSAAPHDPGAAPGDDPQDPRASGHHPAPAGLVGPFTAKHIGILVSLLVVAAVLLIVVTNSPGSGTVTSRAAPIPGASFYLLGEPGTGLEIGDRPPPFAKADEDPILDLDGEVVEIAALEGQPVWVIFWATWCPPCQQETPDVQRAWEAYEDTGLQIVAGDVQESDDIARDYATTYGLTYGIAIDRQGSAFRNWTVFGLPTHYFIGRDGLIQDRFFGPLTFEKMQERLDAISN
ncbi:MAG: TlpA family protein disulfide reductase, partial [Chloroflexota bacterium]